MAWRGLSFSHVWIAGGAGWTAWASWKLVSPGTDALPWCLWIAVSTGLGYAIQRHCESHGYGVVRELVGHGLGKKLHEDPQVPNYGKRGSGKLLQDGMVLAIEPMINLGTHRVRQLNDGWSIITGDKKPSAHFEHDVALVDGRPVVLSTFDYIYEALGLPKNDPVFA